MNSSCLPAAWRLSCRAFASHAVEQVWPASYIIWGANTDVGKTLLGAALAEAATSQQIPTLYLKPLQTGFPTDCDGRLVGRVTGSGNHYGLHASSVLPSTHTQQQQQQPNSSSLTNVKTLFAWQRAVSPHLAVENEGRCVDTKQILQAVECEIEDHCWRHRSHKGHTFAFIETAGGVASPAADGTLQCDLYAALRWPGILVGDGRLGGISATLSALDALRLRGHDVPILLLTEDGQLDNSKALQRYAPQGTRVFSLPPCPPKTPGQLGLQNPNVDAALEGWLHDTRERRLEMCEMLLDLHEKRIARLQSAGQAGLKTLWWPFTQHQGLKPQDVTVLEGRWGENFQAVTGLHSGGPGGPAGDPEGSPGVHPLYDACGSWWTQGMTDATHARMAQEVGYAAGRYLHLMLPENVHQPALEAAELLLKGPGNGWASKVFFSDNGSTAVEVALKMAFRTFLTNQGLLDKAAPPDRSQVPELQVLALAESYHGDTLGAMDCAAPSVFNGILEAPWYKGRGLFVEPPTVALRDGEWTLTMPKSLQHIPEMQFPTSEAIFDVSRDASESAAAYNAWIDNTLDNHQNNNLRVGALIMEPVLQGAGGMIMVDPLFQRTLVSVCHDRGIPVIFDEVFVGCGRLGWPSASTLLRCTPDIACYGKLLTGGALPLAATLTTQDVYDVFLGPDKVHALLHGHSYSGNPIACHAAATALKMYHDAAVNPNLCIPGGPTGCDCTAPCGAITGIWDDTTARELSRIPSVECVVALGTVFAVELKPLKGHKGGYNSKATTDIVHRLAEEGVYARPLGNVVYVMWSPMSSVQTKERLQNVLFEAVNGAFVSSMMCGS